MLPPAAMHLEERMEADSTGMNSHIAKKKKKK